MTGALNDPNPHVRRGAAEALGTLGDLRAVESLRRLIDDNDWNARNAAKSALARLGG